MRNSRKVVSSFQSRCLCPRSRPLHMAGRFLQSDLGSDRLDVLAPGKGLSYAGILSINQSLVWTVVWMDCLG